MGGPRKAAPVVTAEAEPETAVVPEAIPADAAPEAEPAGDVAADAAPEAEPETATVVMNIAISGLRNGEPWPAPGGEITLPADEAETYVRLGYAREA